MYIQKCFYNLLIRSIKSIKCVSYKDRTNEVQCTIKSVMITQLSISQNKLSVENEIDCKCEYNLKNNVNKNHSSDGG